MTKFKRTTAFKICDKVAKGTAAHLFRNFQSPDFRGPTFTWDKFPEIVSSTASNCLYAQFPDGTLPFPELEEYTARRARAVARRLVKMMPKVPPC